jgi:hypothetical protein
MTLRARQQLKRRTWSGLALALLLVFVVVPAGCGGDGELRGASPTALTGLIVDIRGEGSEVRSFTLEADAQSYEIRIAPDVDYGFDLSHLYVHQSDRLPVRCELEERDGVLYALRIDDA